MAQEVAEIYLAPLLDAGIDTLVLGCTHYPILKTTIRKVVGDGVTIVDSAETTALALAEVLAKERLAAPAGSTPDHRFLVTDGAERFQRVAEEFLDRRVTRLEVVHIDGPSSQVAVLSS